MELHMRYGNSIRDHFPETKLYTLQKIHNRTFYIIETAPIKDQIPPARLNFERHITYDRAVMVHMILKEMCPENPKRTFTSRTQMSKYETG